MAQTRPQHFGKFLKERWHLGSLRGRTRGKCWSTYFGLPLPAASLPGQAFQFHGLSIHKALPPGRALVCALYTHFTFLIAGERGLLSPFYRWGM